MLSRHICFIVWQHGMILKTAAWIVFWYCCHFQNNAIWPSDPFRYFNVVCTALQKLSTAFRNFCSTVQTPLRQDWLINLTNPILRMAYCIPHGQSCPLPESLLWPSLCYTGSFRSDLRAGVYQVISIRDRKD